MDFIDLMEMYGFDLDKAAAHNDAKPLSEVIEDIMTEVGLERTDDVH